MKKENRRDGEEPPKVGRLPEEPGAGPSDAGRKAEEWVSSGTEDPAFFIKPSEGK